MALMSVAMCQLLLLSSLPSQAGDELLELVAPLQSATSSSSDETSASVGSGTNPSPAEHKFSGTPGQRKSSLPPVASTQLPFGELTPDQARGSVQWLADLAMQKLPPQFDGDKDWGNTKQIWSGVKLRFEGLKLRTKRRHRDVNHGRWVSYQLKLPPRLASDRANLSINDVTLEDSSLGKHWRVDSSLVIPMDFVARVQRWNRGIKLFSVTVEGWMKVRIRSQSTITFHFDYADVPPGIIVDPRVVSSDLKLESFEVNRVSRIGGDLAEGWGEIVQEVIVERFVRSTNDRLTEKLNRSIDKNRDDLRLSISSLFTGFGQTTD